MIAYHIAVGWYNAANVPTWWLGLPVAFVERTMECEDAMHLPHAIQHTWATSPKKILVDDNPHQKQPGVSLQFEAKSLRFPALGSITCSPTVGLEASSGIQWCVGTNFFQTFWGVGLIGWPCGCSSAMSSQLSIRANVNIIMNKNIDWHGFGPWLT